jgi:hypothetical protein
MKLKRAEMERRQREVEARVAQDRLLPSDGRDRDADRGPATADPSTDGDLLRALALRLQGLHAATQALGELATLPPGEVALLHDVDALLIASLDRLDRFAGEARASTGSLISDPRRVP